MLNRVNTHTGFAYNKDPTIMTWQLMNEPRNPDDPTGKIVTSWVLEISAYVKRLAPMQLCSVGDEGSFNRTDETPFMNEGRHMYNEIEETDFDALIALKTIDYGTYHMYPKGWGIANDAIQGWGIKYLKDHIEAGKKEASRLFSKNTGRSAMGCKIVSPFTIHGTRPYLKMEEPARWSGF